MWRQNPALFPADADARPQTVLGKDIDLVSATKPVSHLPSRRASGFAFVR